MARIVSREIRLRRRPDGMPAEDDFELAVVSVTEPAGGELLVRNVWMSVDPYMRGRMIDRESYLPPFQVGAPLEGGCIGRVVESRNAEFAPGEHVFSMRGWREYFVSDGSGLFRVPAGGATPIEASLGVLGMPGLTAYAGLLDVGGLRAGETVFVSAAAGAVGSAACQIARVKGCRVVGSAGSDEKVGWLLREAGVAAAFNYHSVDDIAAELARLCPEGIDLYFDNVGGKHLEAALLHLNVFGRVVLCGMIDQYNTETPPPGPRTLFLAIPKRLKLAGLLVSDHLHRMDDFQADMGRWIAEGKVKWRETVVAGIENAPRAFLGLFRGENLGKMLVRLEEAPERSSSAAA